MFRRSAVIVAVAVFLAAVMAAPAGASTYEKRNDFNGDYISDVLAISTADNCLYRWNGNGTYDSLDVGVRLGCGWGPYIGSLAAPGDLNSDYNGDIVAINETNGCLYSWYGDGAGNFGAGAQVGCGWSPFYDKITGADLNNDGIGDITAVHNNGCLYEWFGNGAGGFSPAIQVGCGWGRFAGTVVGVGDLNGDFNADLVAIESGTNCLFRWSGNGAGGFSAGVTLNECSYALLRRTGSVSGMGRLLSGHYLGDVLHIANDGCLWRSTPLTNGYMVPYRYDGCGWEQFYLAT